MSSPESKPKGFECYTPHRGLDGSFSALSQAQKNELTGLIIQAVVNFPDESPTTLIHDESNHAIAESEMVQLHIHDSVEEGNQEEGV